MTGTHHFYSAQWLWLLLAIPLLIYIDWKYLRNKFPVLVVPSIPAAKHSWKDILFSPSIILLTLRILIILMVILALSDLRSAKFVRNDTPAGEADIVLALDISRSMLMEDIKPNRLGALKQVLTHFVAVRSTDRFGVVLYAGESMVLCPLTKNYAYLLSSLNRMDDNAMADGTAIGVGLASAVNMLRSSHSPDKVVILLTDGENNTGYIDPMTASEMARRFNIKVYTIGIGTTGMAPYPIKDLNGKKVYVYQKTSVDEAGLTRIAEHTGGHYFRATDAGSLQKIYDDIDKLQKIKKLHIDISYNYEYPIFVFAAVFILLAEMLLRLTLYRTWLL